MVCFGRQRIVPCGPNLACWGAMARVLTILMFTLDRMRTVLLVLSIIVMLKTAWTLFGLAVP
jgi:hypothetical protein